MTEKTNTDQKPHADDDAEKFVDPPRPLTDAERLARCRETVEGQGLSMRAMGDELRQKDAALREAREEVERLKSEVMAYKIAHKLTKEEVKRLREALTPFAALGGSPDMQAYHDLEDDVVLYKSGYGITAGDVRNARRVLGPTSEMHFRRSQPATPSPVPPQGADHPFEGGSFGGGDQGECIHCGRDARHHPQGTLAPSDAATDGGRRLAETVARAHELYSEYAISEALVAHMINEREPLADVLAADPVLCRYVINTAGAIEHAMSSGATDGGQPEATASKVTGWIICPNCGHMYGVGSSDSGTTADQDRKEVMPSDEGSSFSLSEPHNAKPPSLEAGAAAAKTSAEDVERAKWLWDNLPLRKHENKQSWLDMTAAALYARGAEGERAKYEAKRWREIAENKYNIDDMYRSRAEGECAGIERAIAVLVPWLPAATHVGAGHILSAVIDECRALLHSAAPETK